MKTEMEKQRFVEILNQNYTWPSTYTFKFSVPKIKVGELKALLKGRTIAREMAGECVCVTSELMASSGEEVQSVYESVDRIEGVTCL